MMSINAKLYDKYINVTFFSEDISKPKKSVITRPNGFKPSINISGMIIANSFFCNIELRIKNAFIEFDYAPYNSVSIDAGYSGDLFLSAMSGKITQAYIETPGPDGVTVFIVQLTYNGILDYHMDFSFTQTGNFRDVLDKFTSEMNQILKDNNINFNYTIFIPTQLGQTQLQTTIQKSDSMSNILTSIVQDYMQSFWGINGSSITVFNKQYPATKNIFEITRVTTTPRSTTEGHISFTSPWIPSMRPGDSIHINPIYLKSSFGTFQALINKGDNSEDKISYSPGYYSIYSISFEFDTYESINTMIVDGLRNPNIDVNTGVEVAATQNSKQIGYV